MVLFAYKSVISQDKSGRLNMNFPLDLFVSVNPAFTEEGLTIFFTSLRKPCQKVQMKISTFHIALLLPAYIHLAISDKVMPIC